VGRVANFHAYKDFPTLIAAFAKISQANLRARLVLVGRDLHPNNQKLAKLVSSLPFPDKVHILGERSDVADIMPGFDVALSSSSSTEAFPNVIGEAMACGVPMVTTDVGDCRDILGDPARVVACGDALALAEKATKVLSLDPMQRTDLGRQDRARVMERYSIEMIAKCYCALWRRTVSGA
jgi:glycosyltransferase involved in cell wall biosynthesis